jgi:hypothetical protein
VLIYEIPAFRLPRRSTLSKEIDMAIGRRPVNQTGAVATGSEGRGVDVGDVASVLEGGTGQHAAGEAWTSPNHGHDHEAVVLDAGTGVAPIPPNIVV